jgi:hypothetical protein
VSERLKILTEIITHFILYQEEIILFPMISDAVSFLSLRGAQRHGNLGVGNRYEIATPSARNDRSGMARNDIRDNGLTDYGQCNYVLYLMWGIWGRLAKKE